MRITGGLLTAVEYSLQACDHDASPGPCAHPFFRQPEYDCYPALGRSSSRPQMVSIQSGRAVLGYVRGFRDGETMGRLIDSGKEPLRLARIILI
jgi:hypothetical protein